MEKECEYCGKTFVPSKGHKNQRFCCKSCSVRARHKEDIGLFREGVPDCIKKYIIGLITTDGCISSEPYSNLIRVCLNDFDIVKMISYMVSPQRKLYKAGKNYQVAWRNSRDVGILKSMGITPRKSYTVSFNYFEDNMWHYIRGLFDGDGCVYNSKEYDRKYGRVYIYKYVAFTTASMEFAKGLRSFLLENGIHTTMNPERKNSRTYSICIHRQNEVKLFADNIYNGSGMWRLERKYAKFYRAL